MNDPFAAFITEAESQISSNLSSDPSNKDDFQTSNEAPQELKDNKNSGDLLITGCTDWDGMTGSNPVGLDFPHHIKLKSSVNGIFSSSSSCHLFITLTSGELYSMGKNSNGQLGLRDAVTRTYPIKVNLPINLKILKLSTGKSHSLLLFENGELWGCGSNTFGQVGLGEGANSKDFPAFTKIPDANSVRDIACGYEHSLYCTADGKLYAFGHPQYGQLGFGDNGEHIKEGKRGIQFACVTKPKQVKLFCVKDKKGKMEKEMNANEVKVREVAAGKNHSMCLEEWENELGNRVFTWGFGGYGRNGHNSADDEFIPRELSYFSRPNVLQKVRSITAGATYSCAVSASGHFYFWGKLPNSPRGEAIIYPKLQQELYDWNIRSVGAGSSFIAVASNDRCIGWGSIVAGKLGLEDDARSSTTPKFIEKLNTFKTLSISCGYGHCCYLVDSLYNEESRELFKKLPIFNPTGNCDSLFPVKIKNKAELIETKDNKKAKKK